MDQVYLFIPLENWKNWVPTKNIEIKIFDIENSYVDSNMFHKIIFIIFSKSFLYGDNSKRWNFYYINL